MKREQDEPIIKPGRVAPVTRTAVISECGQYRYALERLWDEFLPSVTFIMLNPSTADAETDDPTIRRCMNFAKAWGFGSLNVLNLFAYRATNPKELLTTRDPVGPENISWLTIIAAASDLTICAWGNSHIVERLGKRYGEKYLPLKWLDKLHYLALCKDGTPRHPLYLKSVLHPIKFSVPACSTS